MRQTKKRAARASRAARGEPEQIIIGFDEVGRGALAGPLFVGAVAMSRECALAETPGVLKDSKSLSAKQRERWESWMKRESKRTPDRFVMATVRVSHARVDREGVSVAANRAAHAALKKLSARMGEAARAISLRLDGGLYIKSRAYQESLVGTTITVHIVEASTVARGDTIFDAIKLASIIAKVRRDRLMEREHAKYPNYAFDRNKGYGTAAHACALRAHGPSPIHRLTFARRWHTIEPSERRPRLV